MEKISIVVDVQGNIFKTWVDKKIFILEVGFNPNRSLRVRVRVSS